MKLSSTESNSSIKLLQITDTHLFSDASECLLGVNTLDSFHAVIEEIQSQGTPFDAVLATGDISQDKSTHSYQRFEQGVAALGKPCFWLSGNHDSKVNMESIISSNVIHSDTHILAGDHWQIILLDSQVVGIPGGRISQPQLEYLDNKLSENKARYALVLIHHHPVLVGSAWLDQHTLQNAEALWDVIGKHSHVKVILGGHVHQDFSQLYADTLVITTPSTCVQFKPNSKSFALDTLSLGWRTLELFDDGTIDTLVYRLENGQFSPDFDAGGYS